MEDTSHQVAQGRQCHPRRGPLRQGMAAHQEGDGSFHQAASPHPSRHPSRSDARAWPTGRVHRGPDGYACRREPYGLLEYPRHPATQAVGEQLVLCSPLLRGTRLRVWRARHLGGQQLRGVQAPTSWHHAQRGQGGHPRRVQRDEARDHPPR